jgi:tetratricopeptide (TPR) repeat protein
MANRKPKPDDDRPKRRKPSRPKPPDAAPLPDRRILEGMLRQFGASLQGGTGPETPLSRAQDLMYQAFETEDDQRRLQLAKDALAISPDCADAYVLLAEYAPRRKDALDLYQKGVAAGERALGPEAFQRDAGHFWGILETRPYMRARLGLAHTLWTSGGRDEAVRHLQDMLRLNPGDNQGIRYMLAGFLLYLDRDDDLERLLQQYPDEGMAAWAYTKALLAFRQHGDTPEAVKLLKAAKKSNKYVPDYLLGREFPPSEQPDYYGHGDRNEALEYIGGFLASWKATPGAIAWLRANETKRKKAKSDPPQPKGPLGFVKKWLNAHLPQVDDVWQVNFCPLSSWFEKDGGRVRPWMILVASVSNELVLAHQIAEDTPSAALLWDTLVQAMQHPVVGEPHRPTELQVRLDERWESLKSSVAEIGIELNDNPLEESAALLKELDQHVSGQTEPGLLDAPGVTPEQVGRFYDAAATFFQQAPWKKVGYEAAIKVECDKFHSGPWYAVLMGQSGLTTGLAVYDDIATLRKLWTGAMADEENARATVGTSVVFGEESDLPPSDLDAVKRYGWKVARPDAYPSSFHKERGLSTRPPLAWELELMEGCLRAVPDFVNRHKQDDPAREEFTVSAGAGELRLALSWVIED